MSEMAIWNKPKYKSGPFLRGSQFPKGSDLSVITKKELDQLKLMEAFNAFWHNEYLKNMICILATLSQKVYGPNISIPDKLLKLYMLDDPNVKAHHQKFRAQS